MCVNHYYNEDVTHVLMLLTNSELPMLKHFKILCMLQGCSKQVSICAKSNS